MLKRGDRMKIVQAAACILFLSFSEAKEWCPPNGKISCPCGETGNFVSIPCDPKLRVKNEPCEKFRFCETCSDDLQTCSSCPPGYFGPDCTKRGSESTSQNISNSITRSFRHIEKFRSKRGVNCPDLQSPKLGSIRCWFGNTETSCTARCLPGHFFENREDEEIVLRCIKNRWVPASSFPRCISEGKCDLEMTGAGNYNCTTDSRGTFCDIRCTSRGRWVNNRHFCYPGRSWNPRLPFCVKMKGIDQGRVDCNCQNGGTCDYELKRCHCLHMFEGPFCEHYKYVSKGSCSEPGPFPNGRVVNQDGREVTRHQLYEETEALIYSCRKGYALVGASLLTCLPSGTWSSEAPICRKIQTATTATTTTSTAKPKEKIFCRDPGFIQNGNRWTTEGKLSSEGEVFEVGKSVVFSCKEGYALIGLSILTCQASRRWSNILPECQTIESDELAYCQDPGTNPKAQRIEEPWIDAKKKPVDRSKDEFPQGFKLKYTCEGGYSLEGESTLHCLFTGTWSAPPPTCVPGPSAESDEVAYCQDPGTDPNAQRTEEPWIDAKRQTVDGTTDEFPRGFTLKYSCEDGYSLEGESTLRCLFTGTWSAPPPTCVPEPSSESDEVAYCQDPGTDPNAQRTEEPWIDAKRQTVDGTTDEFPRGFTLKYSCKGGYSLEGDSTLRCLFTGTWSAPPPTCVQKLLSVLASDEVAYCQDPGTDPNGQRTEEPWIDAKRQTIERPTDEFPEGFIFKYSCKAGYSLLGDSRLLCRFNGAWSAPPPTCVSGPLSGDVAFCKDTGDVENGRKVVVLPLHKKQKETVTPGDEIEYPEGVKLEYFCTTGFQLVGTKVLTCTRTGSWSAFPPECERNQVF